MCSKLSANEIVTTPLLEECEDDIHTSEMGTEESFKTPETSGVQLQGSKHLALKRYLYHWKAIEV
jgi:hypothetical protein